MSKVASSLVPRFCSCTAGRMEMQDIFLYYHEMTIIHPVGWVVDCGTLRGLGIGAPIVQVYHEKSFVLPDVSRVLACLYEKDVKFETHTASYRSLLRLQASSHAPVPFYDGPTFLEESREICRYIAEKYEHQGCPFLLGKDALERASVEQWLHNEEHAFNPPSRALFCHLAFPLGEEEDDDIDIHTRKLEEVLEVYEQRLSDSEFLVGNKFTLADLVHLPNSHYIKASNKFLYLYDSRKNVRRWWDAISARDSWKKVLRYMKSVEEKNKQEELKKKQQQEEDSRTYSRTSADPIQLDSRKYVRTEPPSRTILVPPADNVSSDSIVPRTKKRLSGDHLVSTQQGKSRKDVQQYLSQDSEQATSHSVPQEPMSMELIQERERTTRRPYADQSRDVLSQLEDYASSGQRGALLPPSTQEHGVTPSRQASAKDARSRVSSQAAYPGGQDTSKQPRDRGSVPRQGEPQDARDIFDESQAADSTISGERFPYTSQSSVSRQDLDGAHHATAPFESRYTGAEDTSKQAKDKISTPWQMTDYDAGDSTEKTKFSESSSFQVQPSYSERADAPSQKQETIDDTFKETESGDPSFHTTSSSEDQEVNQGGDSVAPPSQTRYQSLTPPSKRKYPIAEDASKQPRGTESKTADEVASTQQPLDPWRAPVSPRRQKVEDSSRADISFQKRHPSVEEEIQVANTASVSWQIAPDGDKNIFEETKLPDSTPTSAKPMSTQRAPFPPRQAEVKDAKDRGRQSRVTIPESQKMVPRDAQTTHGERKTGAPGEQSSDRLQDFPQSRLPAAKGLSTKKDITNELTVVPPLLSNEPTSRVQPASESLEEVASRGGLSSKPSTIEQWQRASVPLNDITSSSGDGEIGMATIDQKLAPMSRRATPSSEDVNQMAKESGEQRVEPPVQIEAETPGVQSTSPSFPGASTVHHATSDDKFTRQSIIDERVGEPTKMPPTPYSAPSHTKRETPDGREIVDSELVSTPDGHISEAAKIRQDQAAVHEDVHGANLSAPDVAKDTFKEAKVAESTPSSAKPMYPQRPAPTSRHAEGEDTWDKGTKGRETVPDQQQMLQKWAGTTRKQVLGHWKASAPSRQATAEDVRGATGDTIQSPDVLDTSKKSRGAYEEAKGPVSVKEEKASSNYQKKPLVAQDSQKQARTIPADGSIRKHQQASDAPKTFVEKLDTSEPEKIKTHGDFSAEQPYRKDTTDDQKVVPPLSTRELTSQVQPPSGPLYDAALHRDLSSKPSTIYQWQRSSVPLHDVTSSSGDDEVAKSTIDEKPTPMSQQKSDEQRVEPPIPIGAEISGVQHASTSFPGVSMDGRATIDDKFAMQSIIDERVGQPTKMQTSSSDAHPASVPTKRGTPEGHESGDLGLVSTPGGKISEAKKARDDPATVHEDVYDANLSTQDVAKDALKETKVSDSIPSSAQPIQKPALTPSRQTQVEEAKDKSMQSRETIPEQQKMVEGKARISGEQLSERQKEIHPSRQPAAEDAPISDTIQSPDILDTAKKSRATLDNYIGPGSTLPKAQFLDAQDSQLIKGESTVPTTDQRKDWKYAKDDETIMTEEKSLSTERSREIFQESASTAPKTQVTDSEGSNALEKTSPVYLKGLLAAQDSQEEAHVIPADEKVDDSTLKHHESENPSASAPARGDTHDGHSAEEQYKKYTADDQKVAPSLSNKEPASQVQPASEPLQRAVPDEDLPSKSFTIDQWQRTAAPLHGVITDSADDEATMPSNNDQKSRPMSQEATPSSQSVNQMAKQSGKQRVEPLVPLVAEASDVELDAPSQTEAARPDVATFSDKFTKQFNVDERVGKPKQMQAPITAAHPASAGTLRRTPDSHEAGELVSTPEGQRLEAAKATQYPATIHKDAYDASLSTHGAAIDEKTATDHATGDEVVTGSLHDQRAPRPASTQAQPIVEAPHDSDSFQYVHTSDLGKTELAKPTVTDQEATVPAARPTSADPQHAYVVPAGVAHSEQKSTPSDKGSARAAQPPSPVEPIKADSDVSAANYTNEPQKIFRQQARPSAPSTIGIPASDTQGVIGKIQAVTHDKSGIDDSGKPFDLNQEHASHASQAIPGQEDMTSPQGARLFPTSDTQPASAEFHEVTPGDQQTVESITPLVSSGKQGFRVKAPLEPGEVGPAEKKFAPSDQESPHSSEQLISAGPRKEQTVIPTAEETKAQATIIGRQDIPERKQALTSEETLNTTATHGDVHRTGTIEPARRPLSVEGEELMSATQAPSPSVARDSLHSELENVQSVKPSATPDARDITPSAPGEAALAEQKSASSGQVSADPAQPAFSFGPRNEEIRDSSPSAVLISSTDPSKGDPMVAERDQVKESQTTPGQQDILSTEHPSRKIQENIPGDELGKAKPVRPSSAVQEGKPSKASVSGIELGSVPHEISVDEQKFAPPGQDSAYLARPPSSAEPRSKEIGDLAPSTQLNFTTYPRNKDAIVAAPDQATDSQTTPGRHVKFSAPSSQGPLGELQEDEPADDSGEMKSSKPPSVVREGKPAAAVPISAPDTQHGAAPDQVAVEQRFAPSGQGSVHSVQTPFSTEPTKEDTVVAATDQTSTPERTADQNYMTPAAEKAKTPFSGTPDASRKTEKSIEDDHIHEKPPSQGQVSPDRHVSESPQGRSREAHRAVDKETTLGSSQAETSETGPGSTSISADALLSSSNMPAASSLPETQDLQDSASAQNALTDSFGKAKPPGDLSTDQSMAPIMSPSVPSVVPQGTVPGTNSVQPPWQASTTSTVDLESLPDTRNGIPQGKATPGEQKSDQEPAHTTERPSSTEPRKEEAYTAAGDQPNVAQGPETTVRHQAKARPPDSRSLTQHQQKYQQPSHAMLPSDIHDGPTPGVSNAAVDTDTTQTSVKKPISTPTRGDVLPTRSVQNQEAQPPPATQAPISQGLKDSEFSQNDSSENFEPTRQTSTDQIVAPVINSAAPAGAPHGTEPGPNSSLSVETPLSTEPRKEDTIVTTADQAEDMQTITPHQAITPVPDTAKPPLPGAQDASSQESISDGPVENYSAKPVAEPPAATLGVSPYASSKSTGQGAKPPTGYQASSPETQLGSSQIEGEAASAEQKFAVSDEKSAKASEPFDSAEPREEDTDAATADQTSVPPTNITRLVTSSTPDASDVLSRDQESSPDDGQIRNLGSPLISSQEEASHAARASEGSTPKVHSAIVDEKMTLPSSEAQTSSTVPDSTQIGGNTHLNGAGVPATSSIEKQESEPPAGTQAPTSKGLQDSGNIESARQASTDQTVAPGMNSAAPSDAPDGTEPGPNSSLSVQTHLSTEPIKEDTIVTTADQAEDMQTITHQQAITPVLDTAKPPLPGAQDASSQESISDDWPVENYSAKPVAQTQPPAATLGVSPYASSKAKSTGQGAKPPTGYQASSPETQLGSSQAQGEAAPAEQKFAVSDEKSAKASKPFDSAEPREEDMVAGTAGQTRVPPTNVTRQVTSSTPDASDALSRDQESSPDNGQIRNLGSPLISSQEAPSRAGRTSEGSTPKVHSATADEKRTLPSSQAQTSSTVPDSTQIGGDARLSGAGMPATSSMEKQVAEPPAVTQAPTSKGLQDSGNIESPRQASTNQTVTPAMNSAAPSDAQESISDDGPVENYSAKPVAQTQPPAATLGVSPYASSKAKSTGQGAKPPTGYQASSPETQLGSSQAQGEAAPAEQKFAVSDEKSAKASKPFDSVEPREEDMVAGTAHQTRVPPTNVTRQVTSSTPDASDALSRDQESSPDNGQIRNLGSPVISSQEAPSRAGRTSEGSTPKVHSATADEKRTLPSSQAQTSSTVPNSTQIGGDARLRGAGMPATSSMEKQAAEPPAATQAPTSKGLQDSGNIKSRQASTNQTVTPAMNSAAPSDAPEGTEPGPNSSLSVQTPLSTEPIKEDTIVTTADRAEDMQTITHQQAITPVPDTAKPPFPGAQDASSQESIADDGPVENYSAKPVAQTQPPAATLGVSSYASSKAKSTGQGAKPPTGYQASSPETQLGSSQIEGEAAPAEQKFAVSDEKSAKASEPFDSAEPREEDTDAATADQTSVPPTNVTRLVTSSTPDASDVLSRDQESSPDDGQIRNLGSPLISSQEEASHAARASEGSTPKVHSAIVDEKMTLPSSEAQTSSTVPDSTQIGGNTHLNGAGVPATSSIEKQESEPPAGTQAPTSKGLQDSGNIESARQASTDQTVAPGMNSAAPSDAPEGANSSQSVQTPLSTEPAKEDTVVTAADQAEDMQTMTHQQAITPAPATGDGKAISKSEHSSRSSEESKVQLQSKDKTQGHETDIASLETGHPSKGGLPANSYQNNSSQSHAQASKKSVDQSSPGIRNKDNDSNRLEDSTDPTKPET